MWFAIRKIISSLAVIGAAPLLRCGGCLIAPRLETLDLAADEMVARSRHD